MHAVNAWLLISASTAVLGVAFGYTVFRLVPDRVADVIEPVPVIIFLGGLIGMLVFSLSSLGIFIGNRQCATWAGDLNREYKFGVATGCRIQTDDGNFVPIEKFRVTSEEDG